MVPAWAAVAIALGAAALGAFAGVFGAYISLRIAQLNIHHEASEAWRTRQLEAAEDFSAVWASTISYVGLVRGAVAAGDDPVPALAQLREKHAEAGGKLMRVRLLFGADSAAGDFARDALSAANHAAAALEDVGEDPEESVKQCNSHLSRGQAIHRDFVRVAHSELRRLTDGPSRQPTARRLWSHRARSQNTTAGTPT